MSEWKAVEFIFADGSKGPGDAAYVGDGWCDCIAPMKDGSVRFWVRSDGTTSLPMNPVRLYKPFVEYGNG